MNRKFFCIFSISIDDVYQKLSSGVQYESTELGDKENTKLYIEVLGHHILQDSKTKTPVPFPDFP